MRVARLQRGWVLVAALVFSACGDDGTNNGGAIEVELSDDALTIQQGSSGDLTATVTASGGFAGEVTITAAGVPTGVTVDISDPTTSGNTTTATVTVNVAETVEPGDYDITVTASGDGVEDVEVDFTLTVTAIPAISLTGPAAVSVDQTTSEDVVITINRTNFTGAVTLAFDGTLPTGVTATFEPNGTTGTTSTLTLSVAEDAVVGTYDLVLRATGTGVDDATLDIDLEVDPPAFFTLDATDVSVEQGNDGESTITITRTNFDAEVTLTLTGLPTGVTHAFEPAATTGGSSVLTLTVGSAVAAGDYTLTVHGNATGEDEVTTELVLTVTEPEPSYVLTLTPAGTVNVTQNAADVDVTVNIDRINFDGEVDLAVSGTVEGLTATLDPTSTTGTSSTLTIGATDDVTPGNYQLTITGTADGLDDRELLVDVAVAGSGGGGNVTLDFTACPAELRPVWLARQNGTGSWTQVVPTGQVYNFNISAGTGAYAAVFETTPGSHSVQINYYTQTELTGFSTIPFCTDDDGKIVNGTVNGLAVDEIALISLAGGSGSTTGALSTFQMTGVGNTVSDLVGYARNLTVVGASDRMLIYRDIDAGAIANNGSLPQHRGFRRRRFHTGLRHLHDRWLGRRDLHAWYELLHRHQL